VEVRVLSTAPNNDIEDFEIYDRISFDRLTQDTNHGKDSSSALAEPRNVRFWEERTSRIQAKYVC
jgi:hypothetical protein